MLILSFSPPKSYDDFFSDTFVPKIILIRIRVYLHEDTKKVLFISSVTYLQSFQKYYIVLFGSV